MLIYRHFILAVYTLYVVNHYLLGSITQTLWSSLSIVIPLWCIDINCFQLIQVSKVKWPGSTPASIVCWLNCLFPWMDASIARFIIIYHGKSKSVNTAHLWIGKVLFFMAKVWKGLEWMGLLHVMVIFTRYNWFVFSVPLLYPRHMGTNILCSNSFGLASRFHYGKVSLFMIINRSILAFIL